MTPQSQWWVGWSRPAAEWSWRLEWSPRGPDAPSADHHHRSTKAKRRSTIEKCNAPTDRAVKAKQEITQQSSCKYTAALQCFKPATPRDWYFNVTGPHPPERQMYKFTWTTVVPRKTKWNFKYNQLTVTLHNSITASRCYIIGKGAHQMSRVRNFLWRQGYWQFNTQRTVLNFLNTVFLHRLPAPRK